MKRIAIIVAALCAALSLSAQTPKEIIERMDKAMDQPADVGTVFDFVMDIPILGKVSTKVYILGDKSKMELSYMGETGETWMDGKTTWTYNKKDNQIVISEVKADKDDAAKDGLTAFDGITEGYDVSLEKETDQAWYLLCKKSRKNKDKDAPRKMNLAVDKKTYLPLYLKMKEKGVGVSVENVKFGFDPSIVEFSMDRFPGATVKDERKK